MLELIRKIEDLLRRVARLESLDSSKIVYLRSSSIRVLDDNVARAAGYINSAVQVTGVTDTLGVGGTLPAKISAVFLAVAVFPTAVGNFNITVKNPSDANNPGRIGGYAGIAGQPTFGFVLVPLNASGQFHFALNAASAMNRTVWDVVGYIV